MAESGAHLTTNLMEKPSIFEVLASDSLFNTFYPAFKRIANFLVLKNPDRFKYLGRFYDELFLLLNTVVQNHYLKTQGGSISEVFYGLTRFGTKTKAFDKREFRLSLLTLVLFPYLQVKLSNLISRYQEEFLDEKPIENKETKRFLIAFYKYFNAAWELLKLIQYLRYLTKRSPSHSPMLQICRIGLTYGSDDQALPPWTWSELFRGKIKLATVLGAVVLSGLESSAFFLQFLQWWQTEAENSNMTSLPIPKAPERVGNDNTFLGICPICLQTWKMPTTCSTSGYVYCYKCIVNNIESRGMCPVTNYGITVDDLVRIYDN